jgi:SAM-dependent methyltransferase
MMFDLNSSYWNTRYLTDDFGWDLGACSAPLQQYIDQLHDRNLKIMIPGGGSAYEAEYLHEQGFKNVYALDFAKAPLQRFKERVAGFPDEHLIEQDFFKHEGQYDLILEQTFFCALSPELRPSYVQQMYRLLKPGGKLAGVLFNDPMYADKPPFGGNIDDYRKLFSPLFTLKVLEPCYNSIKPRAGKEAFIIFEKQERINL